MSQYETDNLAALIQEKHACLSQLVQLGRRQSQLISEGVMSDLFELLSVKQELLTTLGRIERQLDPFRKQNPETRTWRSAADRDQCARLAANCEAMLTEIVSQETHGEAQMRLRRDQFAEQLAHAQSAGEARGAYAAQQVAEFHQLDLSSDS